MAAGDFGPVLPPVSYDESAMMLTEFQESVREELLEAANDILEKLGGVDWYDLTLEDCSVAVGVHGKFAGASIKLMSRGRRMEMPGARFGKAAALAQQLERVANLKWPVERDRRTGQVKGGRDAGLSDLAQGLRAAKSLLALRDAVSRYPELGKPEMLIKLLDQYRRSMRPDAAGVLHLHRMRNRLAKAAGLKGNTALSAVYRSTLLSPKGHKQLMALSPAQRKNIHRSLWKVREKIRLEAEKTGLMGGAADGLLGGQLPDWAAEPLSLEPVPVEVGAGAGYGAEDDIF